MPNIDMNVAAACAEMRHYTLDLLRQIVQFGPASSSGRQGQPAVCRPRERLDGYFFAAFDELIPLAKKVGTAL